MSVPHAKLPAWAEYGLIPLVNLAVAFLISGAVVWFIGTLPGSFLCRCVDCTTDRVEIQARVNSARTDLP